METKSLKTKSFWGGLAMAVLVVVVAASLPDIKRYIRISTM
jgi:hypothetical protein